MKTEQDVQGLSIIAIQDHGGRAWRNNSGVARELDPNDPAKIRYVRYGLGNISERVNSELKFGDLVGIYHGWFCVWEIKPPGWKYHGAGRELAQWNAICLVRQNGGRAGFVNHPDAAVAIMLGVPFGAYDQWGAT